MTTSMLVCAVSNVTNESIDVFWNMSPGSPPACTSWLRFPIVMSLMNQPADPSPAVPPIGGLTKMRSGRKATRCGRLVMIAVEL